MYRVEKSDNFKRVAKQSAWYYADMIRENGLGAPKSQCDYRAEREEFSYQPFPDGLFET